MRCNEFGMRCFEWDPIQSSLRPIIESRASCEMRHEDVNKSIKITSTWRRRWAGWNYNNNNNNTSNDHEIFSLIYCWLMLFLMLLLLFGEQSNGVLHNSRVYPKTKATTTSSCKCLLIVFRALFSSRSFKILRIMQIKTCV